MLYATGGADKYGDVWNDSFHLYSSGLGFGTLQRMNPEGEHHGYTIYPQYADHFEVEKIVADVVPKPEGLPEKTFADPHAHVRCTSPGERKRRTEAKGTLCSLAVNRWDPM